MTANNAAKILETAQQLNIIRNEGVKLLKSHVDTETYLELEAAVGMLETTFRNVGKFVKDENELQSYRTSRQ